MKMLTCIRNNMDLMQKMRSLANQPAPKRLVDAEVSSSPDKRRRGRLSLQDKSVPATDNAQMDWKPPPQTEPVFEEDSMIDPSSFTEMGELATDAALFTFKEDKRDETKLHYILRMPSSLPKVDLSHEGPSSVFNILMVDVSGSMSQYWGKVLDGWNNRVAPKLLGDTVIYTFSSSVTYRKAGKTLEKNFFDGGGTDLTGALQTLVNEIYQCKQKYVNVFIITDGDHNSTGVQPSEVINAMVYPQRKTCNVFILGAGTDFPVEYSVDIRSRLHNGSPNVPSLFWSKDVGDMVSEMESISNKVYDPFCSIAKLDLSGSLLPGLRESNVFYIGEWVYMPFRPEQLKHLRISFNKHIGTLALEPQDGTLDVLKEIFQQWNSLIIQRHRNRETIPEGIMDLKERLFKSQIKGKGQGKKSIRERRHDKDMKAVEMQFREEVSKMKAILVNEKFESPLELAENILSTTVVKSKYKVRSLQLKGHTDKDYESDKQAFLEVLRQHKTDLQSITVTPDDCCRVNLTSTILDLQDEDFPELLDDYEKYSFLKTFTMTGIPVFAPTRDSVALNPWSYSVQKMLKSPYTIMSQSALESYSDYNTPEGEHKTVQLKYDDDNTSFNAVVPVFPANSASVMKPFVKTRLYTMCATFAITKNPHLIDFNIHIASLAATWVRCLYENPTVPRAEHAQLRMESIEATAALYMNEKRYANYSVTLINDTPQALMTESQIQIGNKTLKCETLIKPIFFLHMMKNVTRSAASLDYVNIMRLILMEYIGRCLSTQEVSNNSKKPYTTVFAKSFTNDSVEKYAEEMRSEISGNENELLGLYYTLEKVSKAAKKAADVKLNDLKQNIESKISLKVDMRKTESLRNVSSAGDISWFTLKAFASHLGLSEEQVDSLFNEESVFIYTRHALQYRSSRERMSHPMEDFTSSYNFVTEKVLEESSREVLDSLREVLPAIMEEAWLKAYFDAHSETVQPMTQPQIITEAQRRDIDVSEDTFHQVYKFRPTGLLSNACQTRACPYFLQPNKAYNQHAFVERRKGGVFVHGLHKAAYTYRNQNLSDIIQEIEAGSVTNDQKPIPEFAVNKLSTEVKRLKDKYLEMKMS